MTETNDGYSSDVLGAHVCTLDMHKRLRNLYKNGTKNRKKVVA